MHLHCGNSHTNVNTEVLMESSENEIITESGLFQNEVEGGVSQSSVQQTLLAVTMLKAQTLSYLFDILAGCIFVECWTLAFQVQPRFQNTTCFIATEKSLYRCGSWSQILDASSTESGSF